MAIDEEDELGFAFCRLKTRTKNLKELTKTNLKNLQSIDQAACEITKIRIVEVRNKEDELVRRDYVRVLGFVRYYPFSELCFVLK